MTCTNPYFHLFRTNLNIYVGFFSFWAFPRRSPPSTPLRDRGRGRYVAGLAVRSVLRTSFVTHFTALMRGVRTLMQISEMLRCGGSAVPFLWSEDFHSIIDYVDIG